MNSKTHYKMYKDGKHWCFMALTLAMFSLTVYGSQLTGHAATQTTDDSAVTTQLTSTTQQVTSQSSAQSDQPQKVNLAGESQATVNNRVPEDTTTQGNQAQANDGHLDSYSLSQSQNGQIELNASGWHASGQSNNDPYRYMIVYDNTDHREVSRQQLAPQERPDVQAAYQNVDNSLYSGFNVTINLPSYLATHSLSLVSRYSNNAQSGEGDHVDYWFGPLTMDNQNRASLDSIQSDGQTVTVSGWHASNAAADKAYHYVIVYDQTQGRELSRQRVDFGKRNDVAKAYRTIANAGRSGFTATFDITPAYVHDAIQFISRWTNDPAGNGQSVDYWFSPINQSNQGHLDSVNLSDGHVQVSGWHANDVSSFAPHHFLIVWDVTQGRQIASAAVELEDSSDVANAYPDLRTAGHARFNVDLGQLNLQAGDHYQLVSRYSTSANGNGGNGAYVDYWYDMMTLDQSQFNIDGWTPTTDKLNVHGWMASDQATSKPYAYAILLQDGQEIARQELTLTDRSDVAQVYPGLYRSLQSGFSVDFDVPASQLTGNLQLVLRFTDDANGNGSDTVDYWTGELSTNASYFDHLNYNNNQVTVSGWHAASAAYDKPYQYLIALDAGSRAELHRWQLTDGQASLSRDDVAKAYPWILGANRSGFSTTLTDIDSIRHKTVIFIHRYTDDAAGNGNYVDAYSAPVTIDQWYWIGNAHYHKTDQGVIDYVLNNAEVIGQRPELPTGCEITAVTMMLRYAGCDVNKVQLANEMPRSSDPNQGFMGSPFSNYGYGLWVAPGGVAPVVQAHLGTAQIMTGSSLQAIKDKLINRHLVCVWQGNMHGFGTHTITLTGFNDGGFFYNDPWTATKDWMSFGTFYARWNADGQRALSY